VSKSAESCVDVPQPDDESIPHVIVTDPDDDAMAILRDLQYSVIRNPAAAQAIFSALVAEGRAFAATEAGKRWKERFEKSDLLRRVRTFWGNSYFNLLDDDPGAVLPSTLLDALAKAIARDGFGDAGAEDFDGRPRR
jgi:hypothetical protein